MYMHNPPPPHTHRDLKSLAVNLRVKECVQHLFKLFFFSVKNSNITLSVAISFGRFSRLSATMRVCMSVKNNSVPVGKQTEVFILLTKCGLWFYLRTFFDLSWSKIALLRYIRFLVVLRAENVSRNDL